MVFSHEMYSEDIQKKFDPQINCSYKVWQNLVLQGCALIHTMDKDGGFYTDAIVGDSNPIDYSDWSIYGESYSSGVPYMSTDHVIRITDIWNYLRRELFNLSIDFKDDDPDDGLDYKDGELGLSSAVYEYLKYLVDNGYLIYLNTKIGHVDEYDVKLSDSFIENMSV